MNPHRIDDVTDAVKTRLRASSGKGINRSQGVYWRWSFPGGSKSIWVSDEDIANYRWDELALAIAFELGRKQPDQVSTERIQHS